MTSKEKLLKRALKEFANDYIKTLTRNLKQVRKVATGNLIKSLDSTVYKTGFGTKWTIAIKALDYLEYVDRGRKPGRYPPVNAISRWASVKGIPQSAVFPIMKKIKDVGIRPTNVIQNTLDELLRKDFSEFETNISHWIESVIDEMLDSNSLSINSNRNIVIK